MTRRHTDEGGWQDQAGYSLGDGFLVEIEAQAVVAP